MNDLVLESFDNEIAKIENSKETEKKLFIVIPWIKLLSVTNKTPTVVGNNFHADFISLVDNYILFFW